MKSTPSALKTHMQSGDATLSKIWKATRRDGTVFGFTDHDRDLPVSGVTYKALTGWSGSAMQTPADLSAGSMSIEAALSSDAITEADILAGLWDYATIECFRVNWADVTMGVEKLPKVILGKISHGRFNFSAELEGLGKHFRQTIGRRYGPECDAELGNARCKVRLAPSTWAAATIYSMRPAGDAELGSVVKPVAYNGRHFKCTTAGTSGGSEPAWNTTIGGTTADNTVVWTTIQALTVQGSITSFTDPRTFFDTARTEADDFFGGGKITFTSGLNNGLSRQVKQYLLSGGQIVLTEPMPYAVAVSDTYTLTAGCRFRKLVDCKPKFDNIQNFRGHGSDIPGANQLMSGKA